MKLYLEKITKSYGDQRILDGITAELTTGVYTLVGAKGSGKSTFLQILACKIAADSGRITLDGEELKIHEREIGYMPRQPMVYPDLTLMQTLQCTATLKGIPNAEAEERIRIICGLAGLSEHIYHRIGTLSNAMKRRLVLTQELMGRPKLLLLDDPLFGMNPVNRKFMLDTLSNYSSGKIVLIAAESADEFSDISDHLICLKDGHVRIE